MNTMSEKIICKRMSHNLKCWLNIAKQHGIFNNYFITHVLINIMKDHKFLILAIRLQLVRITNYPTTYTLFDFDIVLEHGRVRCFDNGRDIHVYIEDVSPHYAKALELKEVSFTQSEIPPMLTMSYDVSACGLKEGKVPRCSGQNGYDALRDILRVVK